MWKLNVLFNDFSNLNILFLVTPIKFTYGFPLLLDKISISDEKPNALAFVIIFLAHVN